MMIGSCLASFFLLLTIAYTQPTPPSSFPPSWYTWVVTSIAEVGIDRPFYSVGQLVAYNMQQNWTCRLNQQNLLAPKPNRPIDQCDYSTGKHYMLDSTVPGSVCSGTSAIETGMDIITYPPEYLAVARFFGVDKVNQKDCNHFVASDIVIDGNHVQMDVWTAVDNSLPCQISVTDLTVTPKKLQLGLLMDLVFLFLLILLTSAWLLRLSVNNQIGYVILSPEYLIPSLLLLLLGSVILFI